MIRDEWPSHEAQSLCVIWSNMEFQLTSQMCCQGDMISLHEIETVCFNRLLIPGYQIPHPTPPSPLPIPYSCWRLLRSKTNFHCPCWSVSKQLGVFLLPNGSSLMVLFHQYRYIVPMSTDLKLVRKDPSDQSQRHFKINRGVSVSLQLRY